MSVTIEEIYKVGKKIESEWFQGGANSKFNEKYEAYHKHRKYARGEHDVEHSKSIITGKEAQSHTNYDFSPIQVLPKFKDRLVNSMFPQLYNIEANAIDKYTTDLKNAERERLMSRFVSKELDSDMKELFGIDMEAASDGDRPNSEEEVEMRMAMDWKPNIEIATEMALKYTYQLNNYDEVLIDLLNDAVDIGRIGVWISMHPVRGIVVERMDPAEAVWSFTKKRDHSDVWYYGMRKRITLSELVSTTNSVTKISTGENILLDDEKFLRKLTGGANEAYRSVNQGNRNNSNELDLNEKVDILYFTYETTETEYLKVKKYKSGAKKVTPFKGEYKGQTIKGVDIIPKKKRLWKEGFIILGTDYAYGKGNVTNQIKKTDKGIKKSYPPAYMYANSLYEGKAKGMIERAEVIIDKMQTVEIKIQQLVAAAKPSGIRIDVSKINNIKTAGGVMDYKTVMKIYNETGTEIYHSGDGDHGEFSQGNIHELRNGVVQGINDLVNIQNNYLDQLREALGLPRGVDASSPHPDTAVRIQEQVTRSSNISVSHVLDSVLKITEFSSECVFERIKQVFKYFPHIKDSYIKSIGKINVEIVDDLKKIHLADVGIKLSLKPDAQAQAELEQNIQASLAAGKITLDDAQEASDYGKTSMKLAKQLLRVRRLKKEKDEIANRHAEIEKNGEQQVNLAKQQAAAKEEQLQMTLTIDQSRIQSEAEGKIAIEREKDRLLKERLDIEYGYKIQLAQIEKSGVSEETKFKEQEKRLRQDKNNTDNSRITEQRLNNSPSQDFSQA